MQGWGEGCRGGGSEVHEELDAQLPLWQSHVLHISLSGFKHHCKEACRQALDLYSLAITHKWYQWHDSSS